jgi:RNA polymerase sigma factor (sigma-70 family)
MIQPFDELVAAYRPMIMSIIKKLHITKELDEYYQIGLIALWEASEQFQAEKGNFPSFAYKKIYWKIISYIRQHLRRKSNECTLSEEMAHLLAAPPAKREISFEYLENIFKDLTLYQRKWLIGYIFEGKSLKDIALEEGVSIGAVKQWRIKALQKLRTNWHVYEDYFTDY